MNASISRRLVLWLAVPLMVLALCGALVHYFGRLAPSVLNGDRRLREAAAAVALRVHADHAVLEFDARPDAVRPLDPSVLYAVRDADGRLIAGDARLPPVTLPDDMPSTATVIIFDHRTLHSLTQRMGLGGRIAMITVADVRAPVEPSGRFGLIGTLLWDFVQLDITLVLVWGGIQFGLRPLKRLRDEIAARSPQDLRPIDGTAVPREIAPVVVTLNRLFDTLRASVQSQQQFIANTAHQLRTPLTGLLAQLQLLATDPAAEAVKERLATLEEGIRQLAHSANQLLSLARADPTVNLASRHQPVPLAGMTGEVVARFFDRALQAGIDLGVEAGPGAVSADPALIDDLLSNLVDNALKYTPAGGRVTVSAGVTDGRAYLAVEDSGPGIPESERQRVRQRFYRLPNSKGHGSGLGLAIVDDIARLYGATLSIGTSAAGSGTRVVVHFPGRT